MKRIAVVMMFGLMLSACRDATEPERIGASINRITSASPLSVADPGEWTVVTRMGVPRIKAAVATGADGRIFAFGGFNGDGWNGSAWSAEVYDPSGDSWSPIARPPEPLCCASAVRGANGLIYLIGGANAAGGTAVVPVYDPGANSWAYSTEFAQGYGFKATAGPGGLIYAAGGEGSWTAASVFDPVANTWSTIAPMTSAHSSHGMVTGADGRVYVIGGRSPQELFPGFVFYLETASVERYDPVANTWSAVASLPVPLTDHGVAAGSDGRIYVFGGTSPVGSPAAAYVYDIGANTWTPIANLHWTSWSVEGAASGGRVYAIGGDGCCGAMWDVESFPTGPSIATTTTVLTSSGNPSVSGEAVTLIATVTEASSLAPTGAVTFSEGTLSLGTAPIGATGSATLALSSLSVGSHTIIASYSGDANFAPSTSPGLIQTVNLPPNGAPVAKPGGPYSGNEGAAIVLNAEGSSDPDGDELTFDWDFGDGTTRDNGGATPSHTYSDNGGFTVTLTVTDAQGANTIATATVNVSNAAPDVSQYPGTSILRKETYSSVGSFTDPGADTWTATVNYGDGAGAQNLALDGKNFSLSHVYATAGRFTVTVIVTDDDGGRDTQLAEVIVIEPNNRPVAHAGGPYSANEGAAVSFNASGSSDPDGDALTFDWNFGDNSVLNNGGATPSHAYADNGDFNVTLTVNDARGLSTTSIVTVHVNNVAPNVGAFAGATIMRTETYASAGSFNDPGADSWNATVNYGDGGGPQALALNGSNFSLSHAYLNAGTFTTDVAVSDDDAGAGNNTAIVRVLTPQEGARIIIGGYIDDLVRTGSLTAHQGSFLKVAVGLIVYQLDHHPEKKQSALNALTSLENRIRSLVQQGRLPAAKGDALLGLTDRLERVINAI